MSCYDVKVLQGEGAVVLCAVVKIAKVLPGVVVAGWVWVVGWVRLAGLGLARLVGRCYVRMLVWTEVNQC